MIRVRHIAALALLILPLGCKPKASAPASQTQSLDDLARAVGTPTAQDQCGVPVDSTLLSSLAPADQDKLRRHVVASSGTHVADLIAAFFAVPKPLQTLFFGAEGQLQLVPALPASCTANMSSAAKAFASEAGGPPGACWLVENHRLQVLVVDDPVVIRHSLVRVFGYLYSQFLAAGLSSNKAALAGLTRLEDQEKSLSAAFLSDLKSSGNSQLEAMTGLETSHPRSFGDAVVAEAIDSYYCSGATRTSMETKFPATYAAFTQGSLALQGDLGAPLGN
jgi:hypothetical protein